MVHANLGQAKIGPVADGNQPEQLLLEYTDGDSCTDLDGNTSHIITTIHFLCSKGKLVGWVFSNKRNNIMIKKLKLILFDL